MPREARSRERSADELPPAFRSVPRTGVIYVMTEAARHGFRADAEGWANLGRGTPETGSLPEAPPRVDRLALPAEDREYAPVGGLDELRAAVADHYNRFYRRGMRSRYGPENVCIAAGGRAALTRAAAALDRVHLGHFLPDYTAYEELLEIFRLFVPIPILLDPARGYDFTADELEREITGRGLGALLLSNPCNPTGKHVGGEELASWVARCRRLDCTMLLDEFYSHFVWSDGEETGGVPRKHSAAAYVEDVERDPVVLFDGLTKNWRYPGWRVSWAIGPSRVVEALESAGSFLDGGGPRPLQRAAVDLLDDETTRAEMRAIQQTFRPKRDEMVRRLEGMGLRVERPPDGTFYVWANAEHLPEPLDDGMGFFHGALERGVITVPGVFFDVNPGHRRPGLSRYDHHVRFSFGPPLEQLRDGLDRLEAMIRDAGG